MSNNELYHKLLGKCVKVNEKSFYIMQHKLLMLGYRWASNAIFKHKPHGNKDILINIHEIGLLSYGLPEKNIFDLNKCVDYVINYGINPESVVSIDFFKNDKEKDQIKEILEGMQQLTDSLRQLGDKL